MLDAEHYRNHSIPQYTLAHEIIDSIDFQGDESILDIGCGDGRITAELSKAVPQGSILGIDYSPSMIELAISSFPRRNYPNLTFKHLPAEKLQVDQLADIAIMMNALHWIREPQTALSAVAASLKPNGQLFILTYPKQSPYWRFLEETLAEKPFASYINQSAIHTVFPAHKYKKMIEETGFTVQTSVVEEKIAKYSTASDLIAYIKGWLECLIPLPLELEKLFLDRAVKNALPYSVGKQGDEIQLPFCTLTLKAQKNAYD